MFPESNKSYLATWAESFIFAGCSALLLLISNLFPNYWYFSFFALTPFLYRIIYASPRESLRLGFLFGLSFFAVSEFGSMSFAEAIHVEHPAIGGESPLLRFFFLPSLLRLASGTTLFAIFGWSVGWARERWGFNPSLVALLWVGLEIGLMKLSFTSGLFGNAEVSHPFLQGLVGLFGFLVASAIIVLLNSLLVLTIVKTIALSRPRGKTVEANERTWEIYFTRHLFAEKVYLVPEGRAPPVTAVSLRGPEGDEATPKVFLTPYFCSQ